MTISSKTSDHFVPQVRYRDVEGSARWLCNALGFVVHLAVRDTNGVMDYVHLTHGSTNVIIKPFEDHEPPEPLSAHEVQSHYIYVTDVNRHYKNAVAEGARIVIELCDKPNLGRGYTCRDAEGLIWSFGSFDPWQVGRMNSVAAVDSPEEQIEAPALNPYSQFLPESVSDQSGDIPAPYVKGERRKSSSRSLAAALAVGGVIGALAVSAALYSNGAFTPAEYGLAEERAQRELSEAATRHANEAFLAERSAKEQFQSAARTIESELAAVKTEKAQAESELVEVRSDLSMQAGAAGKAQQESAALQDKLSETEKQWHAVEQSLTDQLTQARATAEKAQTEHAAVEATLKQRVITLELSVRDEQKLRQTAEAARTATDAELREARQGRRQAESALQTALANLKNERQERAEAEERADKLRTQLAARRAPAKKIVRAKPQQLKPVAAAKLKTAPAPKTDAWGAVTAGDIGFQP